jgi:hypothetical protein
VNTEVEIAEHRKQPRRGKMRLCKDYTSPVFFAVKLPAMNDECFGGVAPSKAILCNHCTRPGFIVGKLPSVNAENFIDRAGKPTGVSQRTWVGNTDGQILRFMFPHCPATSARFASMKASVHGDGAGIYGEEPRQPEESDLVR